MRNGISLLTATLLAATLATSLQADETAKPKRTLKGNMTLDYNVLPAKADSFLDIFTKGEFYGRIRSNTFYWDWAAADTATQKDNYASAIGGSLIYKTAPFYGIGTTLGAYYSYAYAALAQADIGSMKAGKDTFSRLAVKQNNDYSLFSLALASVDYTLGKTKLEYGYQMFESVLTKSNDTKMIPNTFNGVTISNKDIEGTELRAAYFTQQKLRDHATFHDVITFKDATGESWNNNDDAGVHKGLTYAKFAAAGKATDHALAIATAKSKFGKDLKTEITYLAVPEVVSDLVLEANYNINVGGVKVIPGVRYMMQMDNGGGVIGGAALKGDVTAANAATKGYTVGDSLNSGLLCARVDVETEGMFKYRLGYSKVNDQADIVAPWRGFPTGGYTRAMAQYNWTANTTTWLARVDTKLSKSVKFFVQYAMQDFDDAKAGVQADSNVIHTDWMFNLNGVATGLELKLRAAFVAGAAKGTSADNSYNEYRVELNYLF